MKESRKLEALALFLRLTISVRPFVVGGMVLPHSDLLMQHQGEYYELAYKGS
jgi:hypothetical protein